MENIKDEIIKLEKATEARLTVVWHEIEEWQRDNHYITSGYRPQSNSYSKSAQSLVYLHNETVNVYTHLIGAVASIVASFWLYHVIHPRYEAITQTDILVFSCFFLGAASCLALSATFHLFSNHSIKVARLGNQLDYLGIVFLIWGSFIPCIYYGFQQRLDLINYYWIMITTFASATAVTTLASKFSSPEWRPFRALMFVALGLSGAFPVFHGLKLFGHQEMINSMGVDWVILEGVLYITGAALYAARIPERFAPGSFDIWGSSHQIFHVLVLMAAAAHLKGLLIAFDHCRGPIV